MHAFLCRLFLPNLAGSDVLQNQLIMSDIKLKYQNCTRFMLCSTSTIIQNAIRPVYSYLDITFSATNL
jgi:hypothetical protein